MMPCQAAAGRADQQTAGAAQQRVADQTAGGGARHGAGCLVETQAIVTVVPVVMVIMVPRLGRAGRDQTQQRRPLR